MSFFGSLFGGGGDYGAGGYLNDYKSTLNQQRGLAGQFGQLGATATNDYNSYDAGQRQAVASYADLLKQNPYTDAYSTAALNQATNGVSHDYLNARAALTADLARRGFTSTGQDSSMLAGGLSNIEAARAGRVATAQNNLAMQQVDRQYQNASALNSLYSGAAGSAYTQATGALGEQGGILGQIGKGQMGLYQNALQQQQASANGLLSLIGAVGSAIPGL